MRFEHRERGRSSTIATDLGRKVDERRRTGFGELAKGRTLQGIDGLVAAPCFREEVCLSKKGIDHELLALLGLDRLQGRLLLPICRTFNPFTLKVRVDANSWLSHVGDTPQLRRRLGVRPKNCSERLAGALEAHKVCCCGSQDAEGAWGGKRGYTSTISSAR